MITYQTEDITMPQIKKRETTEWVKQVAASYGKKVGEIAYIFCSDEKILEVNRQYLEHDYYTDIITFDTSEYDPYNSRKGRVSADIFISLDTVLANASTYETTFNRELYRVIIHGILHCIGFDDHTPEEFQQMKQQEDVALSKLEQMFGSEIFTVQNYKVG